MASAFGSFDACLPHLPRFNQSFLALPFLLNEAVTLLLGSDVLLASCMAANVPLWRYAGLAAMEMVYHRFPSALVCPALILFRRFCATLGFQPQQLQFLR